MRRAARFHVLVGLIATVALSLAVAAPASAAPCQHRNLTPSSSNLAKVRSAVRCLVNRERSKRGIAKLRRSGALSTAAQRHSKNMVSMHFFDHTAPDGSTPQDRASAAGYHGSFIGENIAWGSGSLATPASIVDGWMRSPGHRANILSDSFTQIGIGIAAGAPQSGIRGGGTYVTDFTSGGSASTAKRPAARCATRAAFGESTSFRARIALVGHRGAARRCAAAKR